MSQSKLVWQGKPRQGFLLDGQFYRAVFLMVFLMGFSTLTLLLAPGNGIMFILPSLLGLGWTGIKLFHYLKDKREREVTTYFIYTDKIVERINESERVLERAHIELIHKFHRQKSWVYFFQTKESGNFHKLGLKFIDLNGLPEPYAHIICVDKS